MAFFALACQLTLTFGHVHIGQLGAGKFAALVTHAAVDTTARADAPPPAPTKDPAGLAGDFCAVCANISLAGALVLPVLALILAPGLFRHVVRWSLPAPVPASQHYQPFNARGPPHA
ncbi:MAG: hypothetical protein J2P53_05945 [Bradyrhizobiaceae bacterium]|nr:hypothetical protein [Bradyrhizobiaceae bacterium]